MENTEVSEYHKAIDDLIDVIKGSSIIEAKIFANWVNHFLLNHGRELSEEEYNKLKKAEEVLPMLAASVERYKKELIQEGLEKGKLEGLEKGKLEGLQEGKLVGIHETAIKMKALGVADDTICKSTGLSLEELNRL